MKGLLCGLLCFSAAISVAQDRFLLDKPQNNAIAKVLAHMNAEGFLKETELASGLFAHFPPTRQAVASTIIKSIPRLQEYLRNEQRFPPKKGDELSNLHERRSLYAVGVYKTWSNMLREFAPEIKMLGADLSCLSRELGLCKPLLKSLTEQFDRANLKRGGTQRFSDVPYAHWAERDIQQLRDAGILKGFPNGRFLN